MGNGGVGRSTPGDADLARLTPVQAQSRGRRWSRRHALGVGGSLVAGTLRSPALARAQSATPAATPVAGATREVEHALGTTAVPVDPQRIIALDTLTPAYLGELGIPSIGSCTSGDYVPPILSSYYDGVTTFPDCFSGLPYEELLALDSDLIVAIEIEITSVDPDAYERLSEIAPTVVVPLSEDRVGLLAEFGRIFGREAEAQAIVDDFYAELEELQLKGTFSMPALFGTDTYDLTQDNFVLVELLTRAGMQAVPDTTTMEGYAPNGNRVRGLSYEQLNLLTGEYLIPLVATFGDPAEEMALIVGDNPLWQQLPAVEAGRVIPIDSGYAFGGAGLAGWRVVIDQIAAVVHG